MVDGAQVALSSKAAFERKNDQLHRYSASNDIAILGHVCWY